MPSLDQNFNMAQDYEDIFNTQQVRQDVVYNQAARSILAETADDVNAVIQTPPPFRRTTADYGTYAPQLQVPVPTAGLPYAPTIGTFPTPTQPGVASPEPIGSKPYNSDPKGVRKFIVRQLEFLTDMELALIRLQILQIVAELRTATIADIEKYVFNGDVGKENV